MNDFDYFLGSQNGPQKGFVQLVQIQKFVPLDFLRKIYLTYGYFLNIFWGPLEAVEWVWWF